MGLGKAPPLLREEEYREVVLSRRRVWGRVAKSRHLGALAAVAGILAAVGLLVVFVAARPAEATFPGQPGKIAYSGSAGNDKDIYTINPNGRGKFPVTKNDTGDSDPSYSPNGKRIAFSRYSFSRAEGESAEIFVMRADGTKAKELTDTRAFEWGPNWQPLPQ